VKAAEDAAAAAAKPRKTPPPLKPKPPPRLKPPLLRPRSRLLKKRPPKKPPPKRLRPLKPLLKKPRPKKKRPKAKAFRAAAPVFGSGRRCLLSMSNPSPANLILVGRVAGGFGVRGEVKITTYTEDPMSLAAFKALMRQDGSPALTITSARVAKEGLVTRCKGIETKDAADALRGLRLYVPRGPARSRTRTSSI
jgi:hypothetical protein